MIDNGITVDFILLCETFLNHVNSEMFPLPGYQFVYKNKSRGKGGGVAMYISNKFQFRVRDDLTIEYDMEFEYIFVDIVHDSHKLVIGEIYRVPNSNERNSISRTN